MVRIVLFFCILRFLKIQYYPIDTIAETCRRRTIFKDVSEVGLASAAFHLRPVHPMTMVGQIDDAALGDRLVKARPAAAALEFSVAQEERIAAYRAIVCADLVVDFQGTAVGTFRSFLPGNLIDVSRQNLLPLFIGYIHRGSFRVRIDRVVVLFTRIHIFYFRMLDKASSVKYKHQSTLAVVRKG